MLKARQSEARVARGGPGRRKPGRLCRPQAALDVLRDRSARGADRARPRVLHLSVGLRRVLRRSSWATRACRWRAWPMPATTSWCWMPSRRTRFPMHLLTRDAVTLYLSKLRPEGLLAFHVSNRHLSLRPVLGDVAASLGLQAISQRHDVSDASTGQATSEWVVMARDAGASWRHWPRMPAGRAWPRGRAPACGPTTTRTSWRRSGFAERTLPRRAAASRRVAG